MSLVQGLLVLATVLPGQAPERSFTHDFRRSNPLPDQLTLAGRDQLVEITPEEGGLRIRIEANRGKDGAGVETRFPLRGDFEITAAYEILAADRPTRGYGVGVNLSISPADWKSKRAALARYWTIKSGSGFQAMFVDRTGPEPINPSLWVASDTVKGQLRLRREGTTLHYLVNEDLGQPFREIAQFDYGVDDIDMFRFVANPGNSPAAVDVRLLELQMHWGDLPAQAATAPPPELAAGMARPRRARYLWPLLLFGVLLGVGSVTVYLVQRRKEKRTASTS